MASVSSVSFATTQSAAKLDGALALSILLEENRTLALGTAQSSVKGLVDAIRAAPGNYSTLLSSVAAAFEQQAVSSARLTSPAWKNAGGQIENSIRDAQTAALATLIASGRTGADRAVTDAATATTAATSQPEKKLAADVATAAQLLTSALTQLEANDEAAALATLTTIRTTTEKALADAETLLAQLQRASSPDAARIAATAAVITAARSTLGAAAEAEAAATSPLAQAAGEAASTVALNAENPPTTYLTTYGTSGAISLTDETGRGIVIAPDGRVDVTPPGGDGWQFKTDATFLLPDGTKISFSPGNPASVQATRGEQVLTLTGLQAGQAPTVTLDKQGGLAADAARNDGYVITMGADARAWSLSGATLGATAGIREVVAVTPLTNEYAVDVTEVDATAQLTADLASLGIDLATFDTNHNGKIGSQEWPALIAYLETALLAAQDAFAASIANTKAAVAALVSLNEFLEQQIHEVGRQSGDRASTAAADRDQLVRIQRDLNAGLKALQAAHENQSAGRAAGPDSFTPPSSPTLDEPVRTAPASNEPTALSPQLPEPPPAPIPEIGRNDRPDQSLRRADRLLSGLIGGAPAPRFLPPLPKAAPADTHPTTATQSEPPPAMMFPATTPPPRGKGLPSPVREIAVATPSPLSSGVGAPALEPTPFPTPDLAAAPAEGLPRTNVFPPAEPGAAPVPSTPELPPPGGVLGPTLAPTRSRPADPTLARPVVGEPPSTVAPRPNQRGEIPAPRATEPRPVPSASPRPAPAVERPDRVVSSERPDLPQTAPALSSESTPPRPSAPPPEGPGPMPAAPPPARTATDRPDRDSTPVRPSPAPTPPPALPPVASRGGSRTSTAPDATPTVAPTAAPRFRPPVAAPSTARAPVAASGTDTSSLAETLTPRETGRRLEQHRGLHQEQLRQVRQLHSDARQVVERFLGLVNQDEQLRTVFNTADLSDHDRTSFRERMQELEHDLGLTWGTEPEKTPQGQVNLNTRALLSGMML